MSQHHDPAKYHLPACRVEEKDSGKTWLIFLANHHEGRLAPWIGGTMPQVMVMFF